MLRWLVRVVAAWDRAWDRAVELELQRERRATTPQVTARTTLALGNVSFMVAHLMALPKETNTP